MSIGARISRKDAVAVLRMAMATTRDPWRRATIASAICELAPLEPLPGAPARRDLVEALTAALRQLSREEWREVVTESASP